MKCQQCGEEVEADQSHEEVIVELARVGQLVADAERLREEAETFLRDARDQDREARMYARRFKDMGHAVYKAAWGGGFLTGLLAASLVAIAFWMDPDIPESAHTALLVLLVTAAFAVTSLSYWIWTED